MKLNNHTIIKLIVLFVQSFSVSNSPYCILDVTTVHTFLLTPWRRVLLEKLTGLQLVKKFPAFLWNAKVHYRTHKRPAPVSILGQPNTVHILTFHLLEIHLNIHMYELTSIYYL